MLKFHSIFTDKHSQSDTFFPKLKNTIVKIDIKSFSVDKNNDFIITKNILCSFFHFKHIFKFLKKCKLFNFFQNFLNKKKVVRKLVKNK